MFLSFYQSRRTSFTFLLCNLKEVHVHCLAGCLFQTAEHSNMRQQLFRSLMKLMQVAFTGCCRSGSQLLT